MDFTLFSKIIVEKIQETLGEEYIVQIGMIEKNRGVNKKVVEITKKYSGISVEISLKELYTKCKTVQDAETCADIILQLYKEQKSRQQEVESTVDSIIKWSTIRRQIYPMLVSEEKNHQMLEQTYHIPVMDLAVVFYIRLPNQTGDYTMKVSKRLFELWKVSKEEFLLTVGENMRNDDYEIMDMEEFFENALGLEDENSEKQYGKMAILTNHQRYLGAMGMLDKSLLSEYAERMDGNLMILPSSIHETLLIRDDESVPVEMLNEMIMQINESCVDETEILSDHAYYYDREKNEIRIAG